MFETAPYFSDLATWSDNGSAVWIKTPDGIRLRMSNWPAAASKGTVFILPGRTEYCEKYANVARLLNDHDLGVLAIDWRGQGLADRFGRTPMVGHVEKFADYQTDIDAILDYATTADLPKPWFMLGHSMGGAIGLRTLLRRSEFSAVGFSGPMWGIYLSPHLRPITKPLSSLLSLTPLKDNFAASTQHGPIVFENAFNDNKLTRSKTEWDVMKTHLERYPALQLGGPSYQWLHESLSECDALAKLAAPNVPCLCLLGDNERIVDIKRIHGRMTSWPNATLRMVSPGEHETLMEDPEVTDGLMAELVTHFLSSSDS